MMMTGLNCLGTTENILMTRRKKIMNETTQIRLLDMVDAEIKKVTGDIANQKLWIQGTADIETTAMLVSNVKELEEYRETLFNLRKQIYGGKLDV